MRTNSWIHLHVLCCLPLLVGCSYPNRQLSDPHLLLQDRAVNQTRSAVFADAPLPDAPPTTQDALDRAVRPGQLPRGAMTDKDGFFVGVAISGGGSRSANFAAACMFELERAGFMRHVDYISSVSGGSLAAAYYCSHGPEWNPANVQTRLTHPFANDMLIGMLAPWDIAALLFTDYDRCDLLAETLRQNLFSDTGHNLTYSDLRADRPRLLINATDLQSGKRFVFCNETFDGLNSDLSKLPLGYAVAASASFPALLHPVTLRDFSTTYQQYRHLIDGGVNDNLGVQTLLETYSSQIEAAKKTGRPDPYPHGAVLVVLSAETRYSARLSDLSDVGIFMSLKTALGLTSSSLVNRASSATLAEAIVANARDDATAAELREQIRLLASEGYARVRDRAGHEVRVIYISLAQLDGIHNAPFINFSQSVNSIETYFNISKPEAYSLYEAAELLLRGKMRDRLKETVDELEGKVQKK